MTKTLVSLIILIALTGCSTSQRPLMMNRGLNPILNDYRLIWLSENLEDKPRSYLQEWLVESLIPYVSALESNMK
jgi:hypothetical protein